VTANAVTPSLNLRRFPRNGKNHSEWHDDRSNSGGQTEGTKMTQTEMIELHKQFTDGMATADNSNRGHYEHVLLSLGKLIESHGPTREYAAWSSSTSPTESDQPVLLGS